MIRPASHRRGSIFIVTMMVTVTLAGTVLVLCRSMRTEMQASANLAAAAQADSIERGAEQYVLAALTEEGAVNVTQLSEDQFAAIQVGDGYFWILRPDYNDPQLPVFGLTGESDKLNINVASIDDLERLPNMSADVADAILEWRGGDNSSNGGGGVTFSMGGATKDAPFETVEELLLVSGMTRQYLYGDGTAPPLGQQSSFSGNSISSITEDPAVSRGVYDLLTIYSAEPNTTADGQPRVSLRDRSNDGRQRLLQVLASQLDASRASQILAQLGRGRPSDVFDFANRVQLTSQEIDKIYDFVTTTNDTMLRGRININTAPRDVLLTLDGLDSGDVDKIIAMRPVQGSLTSNSDPNSIGWLWDALGTKAIGLGSQITTRSYQFSADILGVSGNGRAFKRCRIVVDMQSGTPQIVYRRDITDRGWPMEKQILASIRNGQGVMSNATGSGMNGLRGSI